MEVQAGALTATPKGLSFILWAVIIRGICPYHKKLGEKQKKDKNNKNHSYANYPEITTVNILMFSFQILFLKETFKKVCVVNTICIYRHINIAKCTL